MHSCTDFFLSRITFWLSNMIVLKEIICQALGSLRYSGSLGDKSQVKPAKEEQKYVSGRNQDEFSQLPCDLLEAGNFIDALEKAESWIFSRLVDSVWWQVVLDDKINSSIYESGRIDVLTSFRLLPCFSGIYSSNANTG